MWDIKGVIRFEFTFISFPGSRFLGASERATRGGRERPGSGEESALSRSKPLAFFPLVLRAGSPLLTERLEQATDKGIFELKDYLDTKR